MTNVIPMFDFNGVRLRGTIIDDQPWFVAADACRCVGLSPHPSHGNFTHHLKKLDSDEKRLLNREDTPTLFMGVRGRQLSAVTEAGLYKLIQRSNKPEAKAFDRWVRHEVLPAIRRTGGYVMKDADVAAVLDQQPVNPARAEVDLLRSVMSTIEALKALVEALAILQGHRALTYSRYCIPAARDANGTATAFRCPVRYPLNPSS